jgi:Na+/proline symporter
MSAHATELAIFTLLFALVTALGFYAVRWNGRRPQDNLDEWGLGGRRFGCKHSRPAGMSMPAVGGVGVVM